MTSDTTYVWAWLPDAVQPVVAGRLDAVGELTTFTYGRSYLERPDRIPLYLPELPLSVDIIDPPGGMRVAGCIADAGPDSWGQRVIVRHLFGPNASAGAIDHVGLLTLLLESGSDRTGALDFQQSPSEYVPRLADNAPLQELLEAAECLEDGRPLSPALEQALLHGDELKLIYPQDGAPPERYADQDFQNFFLQPMDNAERIANTEAAAAYCLTHPQWRLSLQTHKLIGIR